MSGLDYGHAARLTALFSPRFAFWAEDDVLEALKYTAGRVMAYPATRFMVEGDRAKARYPGEQEVRSRSYKCEIDGTPSTPLFPPPPLPPTILELLRFWLLSSKT